MANVEDLDFYDTVLEGFFNEEETDIQAAITSSGVWKLTQTKDTARFISAEKVTTVPDSATTEDGRVRIVGATESDNDILYVKFAIE